MSRFTFAPAAREDIKFKGLICGPSGSGKTASSLLMAYGLAGDWTRIAVADTEGDSSKQCCGATFGDVAIPQGSGSFGHCTVTPPYTTELFIELVHDVAHSRVPGEDRPLYDVLVIDSLTHVWIGEGGVLDSVDKHRNGMDGWRENTPRYRRMVDAIRLAPIHVVFTLRAKTKYAVEGITTPDGRTKMGKVEKAGEAPVFRDGIDYEATTAWMLHMDHSAQCDKDRTQVFGDRPPRVLTPADGALVRAWTEGAVSKIGSPEWVRSKVEEMRAYSGGEEGLRGIWQSIRSNQPRIRVADYAAIEAAKNEAKARITGGKS